MIDEDRRPPPAAPLSASSITAAAAAILVTWAARVFAGVELPFLFCLGAILYASLNEGLVSGLVATGVTLTGTTLFASPSSPLVTGRNLVIVTAFGAALSITGELMQRAQRREQRAAAHARRREQTLQIMFDDSPAAMLVVDPADRIAAVNDATAELFGIDRRAFAGLPLDLFVPPSSRNAAAPHRSITADGRTLHVRVLSKPIPLAGRAYSMLYLRDESEAIKAAEQLAETQRGLYRIARATSLGQLGSSIAHELNQPLGAIANYLGVAQALLAGQTPQVAPANEALGDALRQVFRTAAVLRKLREFVARRPPTLQWLDVHALMEDVVRLAHLAVKESGAQFEACIDRGPAEILVDAVQIQQVLLNLLVNAAEAVENRPSPSIGLRSWSEHPDTLTIAVEDNGPGVPLKEDRDLFAPFQSTKAEGVGIGLTICRSIVEAHGGRIWCDNESTLGGARFLLSLPRRDA